MNAGLLGAQHRAFKPGKGKVRFRAAQQRARQRHGFGIALARDAFHCRTAGEAQPQNLGGLVKRLTQRIVNCRGQSAVLANTIDPQHLAMPARYQQQQIGELQRGIGQPR